MLERLVCFRIEVYGIGTPVVPTATDTGIAGDFMVGDDLYFGTDELLRFACIGYGAFSQEESGINSQ